MKRVFQVRPRSTGLHLPPRNSSLLYESLNRGSVCCCFLGGNLGYRHCAPPTGYHSRGASLPILPGSSHRRASHPPPLIAKYSAQWNGHGHVVLKVVTADADLRGLNVCHLTKFLRFFCLPHCRPLCFIPTANYIGGTARVHCEPLFTSGVKGGFSLEMTFSVTRSLPTKRVSQLFLPSPSLILSICTAQSASYTGEVAHGILRKRWVCNVSAPPIGSFYSCAASVLSLPAGRCSTRRAPRTTVLRGKGMAVSHWCLPQERCSLSESPLLLINRVSQARPPPLPLPRDSSLHHGRARTRALSAAVWLRAKGTAIAHRPQGIALRSFLAHPTYSFKPPRPFSPHGAPVK